MGSARRLGPGAHCRGTARRNAAPQPSSPGPIQPVRSSRHAYRLDTKHAEALKPSILITPTLFQVFVKLPCPCQARCPGNPESGFLKRLINTHTVILQKQEELLARSTIEKKILCRFDSPPPPSSHAQLYDIREITCHEYMQHGLAFHQVFVVSWFQINA